ncbi:protein fuzzy homolog [Acanthaster planci]|uniref:Protein fuzzy homolog n=1 Tax=Acanthaster planci TaxID=133434 RepID=A0A8B7YFX2_ACAPL|nr:protein fuzzy homolog [Acanthaster planci]
MRMDGVAAVYLVCLTNEGGLPLFTRSKGHSKALAFAEQGMLYGVQMFAQNHDVGLQSTTTEEAKVVWKVFHNSVTLVLITPEDGCSDVHLNTLLDHVFHAMVMFIGLDTLENIKNVERLRRDLKACFGVIDFLLASSEFFGGVCEAVDVLACPENSTLQEPLDAFINSADSTFGCLHCDGRLVAATDKWWSLTGQEMMLLAAFVRTLPAGTSSDVPIYLPQASPKIPHRLVSISLLPGVIVSVLCLETPTLAEAQTTLVEPAWRAQVESLRACQKASLNGQYVPKTLIMDSGILGFLLVHTDQHKCLSSCRLPIQEGSAADRRPLTHSRRRQVLNAFYRNTVGTLFPVCHSPQRTDPAGDMPSVFNHTVKETYMHAKDHKCYAICSDPYQLFVVFSVAVPNYALRSVSVDLLDILSKGKVFLDRRKSS